MREKEAIRIVNSHLSTYDGFDISGYEAEVQFARGYLEAIEKANKLAKALDKTRGMDGGCSCDEDACVFAIADRNLAIWEKEK